MKRIKPTTIKGILTQVIAISGLILLLNTPAQAQHGHLNAGAVLQEAGAPLLWSNGSLYSDESGYVQVMPFSTSGRFAGFFNSGPTMTSLPNSADNGGPSPMAALGGSLINVQLTVISAPEGATFGFWESAASSPTYVLTVGQTTPLIVLGDETIGAGSPGADPFGHIHGRRFSGTAIGDYVIGLRLFDTSDYGPGATPLHAPSDMLEMRFRAVPEPSVVGLVRLGLICAVRRGIRTPRNW